MGPRVSGNNARKLVPGAGLADLEGSQKLLEQDFSGAMAGPSQFGSLVIVLGRDFEGMPVLPSECDAILIVHPNAVAALQVTPQSLIVGSISRGPEVDRMAVLRPRPPAPASFHPSDGEGF